jgi:hypothetical protein
MLLFEVEDGGGEQGRPPPLLFRIRAPAFDVARLLWHGAVGRSLRQGVLWLVEWGMRAASVEHGGPLPPTGVLRRAASPVFAFQPENLLRNACAAGDYLRLAKVSERARSSVWAFVDEFLPAETLRAASLVVPHAVAGLAPVGLPDWDRRAAECLLRAVTSGAPTTAPQRLLGLPSGAEAFRTLTATPAHAWLAQLVGLQRLDGETASRVAGPAQELDARIADVATLSLMAQFASSSGASAGTWRAIERALRRWSGTGEMMFCLDTPALVHGLVALNHMPRLSPCMRTLWLRIVAEIGCRWVTVECGGPTEPSARSGTSQNPTGAGVATWAGHPSCVLVRGLRSWSRLAEGAEEVLCLPTALRLALATLPVASC